MEDEAFLRMASRLVDTITDKNRQDWDLDSVRKLKTICKTGGEPAVQTVFKLIMGRIKDQHARARLHAVSLVDVFVNRSAVFRQLLASNFTQFLECSVGHRSARPLPPPAPVMFKSYNKDARQLRQKALECVECWTEDYGDKLPQIKMGHTYLQNVIRLKFPQLRSQEAALVAEAAAREERSKLLNAERYAAVKETYAATLSEIGATLDEMETAFRLLEGKADPLPHDNGDEDWEDVEPAAAEDKGDISKQCSRAAERPVPVLKNADPAVLETLRGSYKLLVGRHLPTVLEWLSLAVKADAGQPGSDDGVGNQRAAILKAAIAARDRIGAVKTHCEALMSELRQHTSEGAAQAQMVIEASAQDAAASDFQIAVTGGSSAGAAPSSAGHPKKAVLQTVFGSDSDDEQPRALAVVQPSPAPQSKQAKPSRPVYFDPTYRHPEAASAEQKGAASPAANPAVLSQTKPGGAAAINAKKRKIPAEVANKLLQEAPMLPGGTHLAYWDSDSASLLNNKAMEVYNHWGAVDEHVALPESVVSQFFTTRATYYDPTQKERKRAEAEEVPEDVPAEPAKKVSKVTAIGFGSSPSRIKLPPPFPPRREPSSKLEQPKSAEAGQIVPFNAEKADAARNSGAAQKHGVALSKPRTGKDKASQRALDKAHNDAILAGTNGGPQDLALQLALQEPKAKGKSKKTGSVRDRLAAKLFSGKAFDKANSEQDALESERTRDQDSHRFVS